MVFKSERGDGFIQLGWWTVGSPDGVFRDKVNVGLPHPYTIRLTRNGISLSVNFLKEDALSLAGALLYMVAEERDELASQARGTTRDFWDE